VLGFVVQTGLWLDFALLQRAYGLWTRYAKCREGIEDRDMDLHPRNLSIEVARRQALTE
jgi:hypothetical protein